MKHARTSLPEEVEISTARTQEMQKREVQKYEEQKSDLLQISRPRVISLAKRWRKPRPREPQRNSLL
jgi:hypothetical protein